MSICEKKQMKSEYITLPNKSKKNKSMYLFKFLLLANISMYLEAGAVPAMLLQIADSFGMTSGEQGLLGGIVYLSLGFAGTFAGFLLRHYDHRTVLASAVGINNVSTLVWALTPVNYSFSAPLFITIRFFMGLTQCVVCVFLPLWTNEYAPLEQRTSWMSYLQASVPIGVMLGYVLASIVMSMSHNSPVYGGLLSWRWPILLEVLLVMPFCIAVNFVPREHINVTMRQTKSPSSIDLSKTVETATYEGANDTLDDVTGHSKASFESDTRLMQLSLGLGSEAAAHKSALRTRTPHDARRRSAAPASAPSRESASSFATPFPNGHCHSQTDLKIFSFQDLLPDHSVASAQSSHKADVSNVFDNQRANPHKAMSNTAMEMRQLRHNSVRASLFNAMAARDILRRSSENLVPYIDFCTEEQAAHATSRPSSLHSHSHSSTDSGTRSECRGRGRGKDRSRERAVGPVLGLGSGSGQGLGLSGAVVDSQPPVPGSSSHRGIQEPVDEFSVRKNLNHSFGDSIVSKGVIEDCHNSQHSLSSFNPLVGLQPIGSNGRTDAVTSTVSTGPSSRERKRPFLSQVSTSPVERACSSTSTPLRPRASSSGPAPTYQSLRDVASSMRAQGFPSIPQQSTRRRLRRRPSRPSAESLSLGSSPTGLLPRKGEMFSRPQVRSALGKSCSSANTSDDSNQERGDSPEKHLENVLEMQLLLSKPRDETENLPPSNGIFAMTHVLGAGGAGGRDAKLCPDSGRIPESHARGGALSLSMRGARPNSASSRGLRVVTAPVNAPADTVIMAPVLTSSEPPYVTEDSDSDSDCSTDGGMSNTSLLANFPERSPNPRSFMDRIRQSAASPLLELLCTPVYMFLVLAMAALYFVVTGVQFWGTSYMSLVLEAPLPLVNGTFILCAASGPTLGVFFGGWLVDRYGGYTGLRQRVLALKLCFGLGFLACMSATGLSFVRSLLVFVPMLWSVLFFGGAILPACSGMVVSVIPRKHRTISASVSMVIFNLFGYCLSLVLSGYVMQAAGSYISPCDAVCARVCGFRLVLLWSYWSLLFLGLALHASLEESARRQLRRLQADVLRASKGTGLL